MKKIVLFLSLGFISFMSCEKTKTNPSVSIDTTGTTDKASNDEPITISDTLVDQIQTEPTDEYFFEETRENQLSDFQKDTINLYPLHQIEDNLKKNTVFISLSDIYSLSEHPDSLAIGDISHLETDSLKYLPIKNNYRELLLSKTNLKQTDSLFIYDYKRDIQFSFALNSLDTGAYLSPYSYSDDGQYTQWDYMIGFEIKAHHLKALEDHLYHTLAYFGAENPFEKGQMEFLVWQKIDSERIATTPQISLLIQELIDDKNVTKQQAYFFENSSNKFYIQDYIKPHESYTELYRQLIVMDKASGKLVHYDLFSDSESAYVSALNYGADDKEYGIVEQQWTGKLLKNRPQVIFGFLDMSFGCPTIDYIEGDLKYIPINCDNRH